MRAFFSEEQRSLIRVCLANDPLAKGPLPDFQYQAVDPSNNMPVKRPKRQQQQQRRKRRSWWERIWSLFIG